MAQDTDSDQEKARAEESKTHRHLTAGEPVMNGDIYGGTDWGFVYMIGSSQVEKPKAGEPCDTLIGYRIRRKI